MRTRFHTTTNSTTIISSLSLSYHFVNNSQWSFHCYPPLLLCFFINVFPICSNHFNLPAFHVSHVFFIYQYLAIFRMFLSYPTSPTTIFFQLSHHSPIPNLLQFPSHFWPFLQRFPHLFPKNPNCQQFFSAFFPTCSWHFIIVFLIFPPFCPACFFHFPRVFPHVHPILSAFSYHFPTIFLPFPIPPVASRSGGARPRGRRRRGRGGGRLRRAAGLGALRHRGGHVAHDAKPKKLVIGIRFMK